MGEGEMKDFAKVFVAAFILVFWGSTIVWAGQNSSAGIRIDLDWNTNGNQNLTYLDPPPSVGSNIYVDIYVINASNLDTYELNLLFDYTKVEYVSAIEDAWRNDDLNILKKNDGQTTGWTVDTSVPGVVNIANTLVGSDPAEAPEGEGLLASVKMEILAWPAGDLTFGDVSWRDNEGVEDVCNDKGEASLPVQMSDITATADREQGVILTWRTESEVDCAGFHVWRSEDEETEYERITTALIPGQGNSSTGHEYSYTDGNVEDGVMYWYKIEEVSTDGSSTFHGPINVVGVSPIPTEFSLSQNYPNPFNPETAFAYTLPEDSEVSIRIYDLLGKEVKKLVGENQQAGYYTAIWDGLDDEGRMASSGIYFICMQAGGFKEVRKMTLIR